MKNINDYKGTKTAIHCKTQEEWDKISELLCYTWVKDTWSVCEDESCINCNGNEYCDLKYYTKEGYTIIPASDFIPTPRTIEQIETELEVLRNELKLLKAEAQTPKKKPIRFAKAFNRNKDNVGLNHPQTEPKEWKNIELIAKAQSKDYYDVMFCFDKNRNEGVVFLGHWNDGIK